MSTHATQNSLFALLFSLTFVGAVGCASAEANPRPVPQALAASASLPRVHDGCEMEERVGPCSLEDVRVVESQAGVREVVAVYRVTDGEESVRAEHRYRVSYLAAGEVPHMNFLRANPNVSCRWQTVRYGTCPAHPATAEVPESNVRERRPRLPRARARNHRSARHAM